MVQTRGSNVMLPAMGAAAMVEETLNDAGPRLRSAGEFAAARGVFEKNGYNYPGLCERLGVARLYEYQMPPASDLLAEPVVDGLDALARLFCKGLALESYITSQRLTPDGRNALFALGLLAQDPDRPEMDFAPNSVLPFVDSLCMSDRFSTPTGQPLEPAADAVYPALFDNTYNFVTRIPETPCEMALDLGTGAGAAAIRLSRVARRVWATDINARAALFTDFNCRLNGCHNVSTASGDLFEPVRGLRFDRIVTQPPYTAVASDKVAYRDGGKDGEQIFRRTVEGLPDFLNPGGACYALLMATDREGEPFERRIQKWLGAAASEFDILIACDMAQEPIEFLQTARKIPPAEREYRRVLYQETRTRAVLYCSVLIRRKRAASAPVLLRTFVGPGLRGEDLDFYLALNMAASSPKGNAALLAQRPRLGRHCRMMVTHSVQDGRLVPEEYELKTSGKFVSRGKAPAWVAALVAECNGSSTWEAIGEEMKSQGRLPSDIAREDYARVLAVLVSNGVLEASEESFVFDQSWW